MVELGDAARALEGVAVSGLRLTESQLLEAEQLGARVARDGAGLPAMVDAYLSATRQLWTGLPASCSDTGQLVERGSALLLATEDALAAAAQGFSAASGQLVREAEATRREFVDDLLSGRVSPGRLAARAERFGLRLATAHVAAVVAGPVGLGDAARETRQAEQRVREAFGARDTLVATKEGRLVCVVPAQVGPAGEEVAGRLGELCGELARTSWPEGEWLVCVGRPRQGPSGIHAAWSDALEAVELGTALGLHHRVVRSGALLVYRVLLRDTAAMADLVQAVLEPLTAARGGAEPLLDTLEAWFESGGSTAGTARRLHISVRAVTYRLARVESLTGHSPAEPDQRLALEVAVIGARLLRWPERPLPV